MSKNRLDFQAQLSRHSHDVSAGYSSSLTTGPIVPQYYHVLQPGDTLYFDVHMFTRMQDVVTAFLGEVDVHLDAFFVPLQMLYTPFGQIYSQTDDFISSKFDLTGVSAERLQDFPVIPLDGTIASRSMSAELTAYVPSECWGKACFRLLDALGCNPLGVCSAASRQASSYEGAAIDDSYCHNPNISPWLFAAYQAIYQKFFRNDEVERLKVYTYNFDKAFGSQVISSNAASFITLRYCQRPQDYFTRVRVSPIASAVNSIYNNNDWSSDGGSLNNMLSKVNSFLTSSPASFRFSGFGLPSGDSGNNKAFNAVSSFGSIDNYADDYLSTLNAANIRALFAVDKFSRIYGRADKTYDDQILAHFGIQIPHDVKHDATRIKSWRFGIGSEPIYGTNNNTYLDVSGNETNSSVIGQVGGQAQGTFNSQQEKFTAPVHGVFMIVAYALTKPRYCNTFDKLNMLTDRLSFPIPEFDKLGAQPLYKFEVTPYFLQASMLDQFLGWQNRYAQFKEKYNRISYTFAAQSTRYDDQSVNVYAPWLLSRPVFSGLDNAVDMLDDESHFPSYELFQENVNALNIILRRSYTNRFATDYFSQPHLILQSDPLITEFMCNAKLVSWMSETGEPDL